MKYSQMSAVAVLSMARSDSFTTDEPENISVSDLSHRKKCLDEDENKTTIHSGNFMVTSVHFNEYEEEDEAVEDVVTALSPVNIKKEGFDFETAKRETSQEYSFGHNISIDGSLTKLFQCMTLAYSGKLTSPKFKLFKGLKLMLKDKLRLNNIIWREWHMQFIKSRKPIVCQFSAPLETDVTHARAEAIVMEGKYWKRRLDTVTLEYKKWRVFFKEKYKKMRMRHQMDTQLTNQQLIAQMPPQFNINPHTPMSFDDDFMMDFVSDTLFSSLNQPFAFPNAREINYMANPDFIQPGLIQLQPSLDDFMDTLDPLQEMIATSRANNVVTFTGQEPPASTMYDAICSAPSGLQDTFAGGDLLSNAVDLAESITVDQNITLDNWTKNYSQAPATAPVTYTTYQSTPVNKLTLAPVSTYSLVAVTQPIQPVTIQHSIQPLRNNKDNQFAVPMGKAVRSKQRLIAPAPTPPVVQTPTIPIAPAQITALKNNTIQNNSCLAQLLTSGSYHGLKTETPSTSHQPMVTASPVSTSRPIQKKPSSNSNKTMTLAKMLATESTPVADHSTADTVASILAGVVEHHMPSPSTPPQMRAPIYSHAVSSPYTSTPISIPHSPANRRDSTGSNDMYDSADNLLDQASSPSFDLADSPVEGYKRPKTDDRAGYKEQRRALHISAEQKRRVNIKSGFDMLHTLIPSLQHTLTAKVSKAQMLQKTAEHCRKLKKERGSMQDEAQVLRQEIETLKDAISNCQAQLPATGVPVTRQRTDHQQELFEEYVKNRTMQNWKFWIFSRIIRSLFASYNNLVSTASIEDLCRSVLAWLDQHCSLVQLRPEVGNSLRELSTTTSILSNPAKVREEAIAAVTKHERRDSI